MLKAYIIAVIVVAWASGEAATAYLKGWEDGEAPEEMFEEMISSEEKIAVSWKLSDKTYEEMRHLYHRKYGREPPTRANMRLLVNKFRGTGSVADEKCPRRSSASGNTVNSICEAVEIPH